MAITLTEAVIRFTKADKIAECNRSQDFYLLRWQSFRQRGQMIRMECHCCNQPDYGDASGDCRQLTDPEMPPEIDRFTGTFRKAGGD